jgi:hypothetical protein
MLVIADSLRLDEKQDPDPHQSEKLDPVSQHRLSESLDANEIPSRIRISVFYYLESNCLSVIKGKPKIFFLYSSTSFCFWNFLSLIYITVYQIRYFERYR